VETLSRLRPDLEVVAAIAEQQAVAFGLAAEVPLPDIATVGCGEKPFELSTSGSASRFFGVRSGRAGSRSSCSSSTRKRKNDFSAAVARAWLDGAGLTELRATVRSRPRYSMLRSSSDARGGASATSVPHGCVSPRNSLR
jgi:hypothetical protein